MTRIVTFGCRLNINETEAMKTAIGSRSDLAVINSCAVTSQAARDARHAIRKLKREDPDRKIVVTGCAAQVERERFAAMDEVAFVVGNAEKLDPQTWRTLGPESGKIVMSDIMTARNISMPRIEGFQKRARGFVQIQNGCDHRCTFCIIPFGRGNSRSMPPHIVIDQIHRLVEAGHREVVLTGVDLTSYGPDMAEPVALGGLVQRILRQVPELTRLRLSSIDSVEADAQLLEAIAGEERLMPHLHLSLQSGDDLILKRMKRRHSRADAIRFCEQVRKMRPDIVFGADIIAGFPTEDEAMFTRSLELVDECGITYLHAFPFSPRPGTPAARMPPVAPALVRERAARLREAGDRALMDFLDNFTGRTEEVLAEHGGIARTVHFAPVRPAHQLEPGTLHRVTITGREGQHLLA